MSDYYRKDWMSDDQFECYELLADAMGGFHHVVQNPKEFGFGICLNTYSHRLSTFDFNLLTTLVFLAHDRMIRIEIQSSGPRMVKICLHKRHAREGSMSQRHPTVETALAAHRERFPTVRKGKPRE